MNNKYVISEKEQYLISNFMGDWYPQELDWNLVMPILDKVESTNLCHIHHVSFNGKNPQLIIIESASSKNWLVTSISKETNHCNRIKGYILPLLQFIRWYNTHPQQYVASID